jgi:hypothetical protein
MGLFNSILEKLGVKAPAAPAAPAASNQMAPNGAPSVSQIAAGMQSAADAPISVVDVMGKLDRLAAKNPEQLDWKVSIVDLLKLLDLDSSLAARTGLATELGCPANLMDDSARMNMWLHKTVLQKLADNGGNIPQSLLK